MPSGKRPLLAYFGHHKCASTWIESICDAVCRDLNLRFAIVYDAGMFGYDLNRFVATEGVDFLAYANADYRYVKAFQGPIRGFHVVRDPRDIVVSAYFSHLHSHPTKAWPELIEFRRKLKSASIADGLLMEMDFRESQFSEMQSWPQETPGIVHSQMEELTGDPYRLWLSLFRFLDLIDESEFTALRRTRFFLTKLTRRLQHSLHVPLPLPLARLPAERVLGIVWENDFARKSGGRAPGEEDPTNHYRKGVAGDWKNHFNERHLAYFNERYGDLLTRYNYDSANSVSPKDGLTHTGMTA